MSIVNHAESVELQYADDKNFTIRGLLHAKYSTSKQDMYSWLFDQYSFSEHYSILELGCGNGAQWEKNIERLPYGCSLSLTDISEGMIDIVTEKYALTNTNVTCEKMDIQAIKFENESFDIVMANHMLYHVPDLEKALSEVCRVLKTGGVFYATTLGNNGMALYIHNALKIFDPETTAFLERYAFSLQNGRDILSHHFTNVKRIDFADSLAITSTQDLMNWIASTMFDAELSTDTLKSLTDYFEAIRARDGVINVPKEIGLFICVKS